MPTLPTHPALRSIDVQFVGVILFERKTLGRFDANSRRQRLFQTTWSRVLTRLASGRRPLRNFMRAMSICQSAKVRKFQSDQAERWRAPGHRPTPSSHLRSSPKASLPVRLIRHPTGTARRIDAWDDRKAPANNTAV